MFLSSVLFLASASTFSSAMFVSGTRNFASSFIWYEKLVQVFWYQFSVPVSGACVIGISLLHATRTAAGGRSLSHGPFRLQ